LFGDNTDKILLAAESKWFITAMGKCLIRCAMKVTGNYGGFHVTTPVSLAVVKGAGIMYIGARIDEQVICNIQLVTETKN
jgi:hypothetical protein